MSEERPDDQVNRAGPRLLKGNEAAVYGALLAGCRSFYGYPITPASELAESAARLFPISGGTFLQAESEIAAINMLYGAAASGERTMTASSSPGISLMMEGISYSSGSQLPMVVVDVMRGGPGLGNIGPEQGDYFQLTKGGGHGCYRTPVLAPASAQEMADLTRLAFDLADRYRTPVFVAADGFIGQMMEPVRLPLEIARAPEKPWAVAGTAATRANLVTSIYMSHDELEAHERRLQAKYAEITEREIRFEQIAVDDAEILLIGYGIVARILRRVVGLCRAAGIKAGLLRPITLWPFPSGAIAKLAARIPRILVAELSNGQMVDDVRLAVLGQSRVSFYGRMGGNVPAAEEIVEQVRIALGQSGASRDDRENQPDRGSEVRRVEALA